VFMMLCASDVSTARLEKMFEALRTRGEVVV
jgi:hypothetical protein